MPQISIVIPCFNDNSLGILRKNLTNYSQLDEIEIICIDGGSSDGTVELIKSYTNVKFIQHQGNRIGLINKGIKEAKGEYILIHHPRSWINPTDFEKLKNLTDFKWGAFTHRFDQRNFIFDFTSWYSNNIRGDLFYIYYLDHCLLIHRSIISKVQTFKDVPIFEDTEMCKKLRFLASPIRLKIYSTTSSIRFKRNGLLRQVLLNQLVKLLYLLKFNHVFINKVYERGLNLNSNK